jgi:predicted nucleic acid-binding protein
MLVSGCSPSIFNQVVAGITKTPYEFMLDTLNRERYNSIMA